MSAATLETGADSARADALKAALLGSLDELAAGAELAREIASGIDAAALGFDRIAGLLGRSALVRDAIDKGLLPAIESAAEAEVSAGGA